MHGHSPHTIRSHSLDAYGIFAEGTTMLSLGPATSGRGSYSVVESIIKDLFINYSMKFLEQGPSDSLLIKTYEMLIHKGMLKAQ